MALKVIKKGTYQPISPLLKEGIKNVSAQNCEWAQLLSHVLLLVTLRTVEIQSMLDCILSIPQSFLVTCGYKL